MSIFDFLFKKKKEEPVVNLTKNLISSAVVTTDEDGTVHTQEYILAKNICSHLKVAGTKYYLMEATDYSDKAKDVKLYLRCRFHKVGKNYIRESLKEQLVKSSAVVATDINGEIVTIDLEKLLKGKIDYILIDKDEDTGEVFYYFSFKGVEDKVGSECTEGYLVMNDHDGDAIDYLCNLM